MVDAVPSFKGFSYRDREASKMVQSNAIKIATSNLFMNEPIPAIDLLSNLVFEDIGGMEFIDSNNEQSLFGKSNSSNLAITEALKNILSGNAQSGQYGGIFHSTTYPYSYREKIPVKKGEDVYIDNLITLDPNSYTNVNPLKFLTNFYWSADTLTYAYGIPYQYIVLEFKDLQDDEYIEIEFIEGAKIYVNAQ